MASIVIALAAKSPPLQPHTPHRKIVHKVLEMGCDRDGPVWRRLKRRAQEPVWGVLLVIQDVIFVQKKKNPSHSEDTVCLRWVTL